MKQIIVCQTCIELFFYLIYRK